MQELATHPIEELDSQVSDAVSPLTDSDSDTEFNSAAQNQQEMHTDGALVQDRRGEAMSGATTDALCKERTDELYEVGVAGVAGAGVAGALYTHSNARTCISKPESPETQSRNTIVIDAHPIVPRYLPANYQDSTQTELQDEVGYLNPVVPIIPRYKSNRLSVLSMASSLAMISPFIRSHINDDGSSPSDYYTPKDTHSAGCGDSKWKASKRPGKGSAESQRASNIDRLSVLMQRAVVNAKKKRNQGITEQTLEEWSTSLESCFEIPEDQISLDIEDQRGPYIAGQIDSGIKAFSTVTSRTKKSINSWSRKSRMWFSKSSKNQSSPEYLLNDTCSFVTVPDANEREYYATTPHNLSLTTINQEVSQGATSANVKTRKSFLWGSSQDTTAKPDRKPGKVSRFFKSLLSSQSV